MTQKTLNSSVRHQVIFLTESYLIMYYFGSYCTTSFITAVIVETQYFHVSIVNYTYSKIPSRGANFRKELKNP